MYESQGPYIWMKSLDLKHSEWMPNLSEIHLDTCNKVFINCFDVNKTIVTKQTGRRQDGFHCRRCSEPETWPHVLGALLRNTWHETPCCQLSAGQPLLKTSNLKSGESWRRFVELRGRLNSSVRYPGIQWILSKKGLFMIDHTFRYVIHRVNHK